MTELSKVEQAKESVANAIATIREAEQLLVKARGDLYKTERILPAGASQTCISAQRIKLERLAKEVSNVGSIADSLAEEFS